jgi:plastocyanin
MHCPRWTRSIPALATLTAVVVPVQVPNRAQAPPQPEPVSARPAESQSAVVGAWGAQRAVMTDGVQRHATTHKSARKASKRPSPIATPAASSAVSITDFKFGPATVTIHAGDTITWTNNGATEHTATASGGTFDTGLLSKGKSASHNFPQAGTFKYICSVHPFMLGTVVVLAAATTPTPAPATATTPTSTIPSSTTPTTAASTTTGSSTAGTTSSSARSLPMTGLDLVATLVAALALGSAGLALRRRTADR